MVTPLATLEARARKQVDSCQMGEGEVIKYVHKNDRVSFILKENLIKSIAKLLYKHEKWVDAGRPKI